MSEKPSDRPDTNLSWAEDPSPNQVTEPAAKRAKGWFEGTSPGSGDADKHPAGYENWLDREHGRHITHLEGISPRQFEDFPDLWDASEVPAVPDLFRIVSPATGLRARGEPYWTKTSQATGTGTVLWPCTDNEWIYYISGSGQLSAVAVKLSDGLLQWEQVLGSILTGLCCDGNYLYWSRTGFNGIFQRAKSDGSAVDGGGSTANPANLACNGVYVVGTNIGTVAFYTLGPVTETGTAATGSTGLNASAIDDSNCYVGGSRSGSVDVWAYDLSTRAPVWTSQITGGTAPAVNSIATDSHTLFVGTTRVTVPSVGSPRNLFALCKLTGAVLWMLDVGSSVNVAHVAVDDTYLYIATSALDVFVYMLPNAATVPPLVEIYPGTWGNGLATDGVSLIGGNGGTSCKRSWNGSPSKLFQRVNGDDPNRRPMYTQAMPVEGRI